MPRFLLVLVALTIFLSATHVTRAEQSETEHNPTQQECLNKVQAGRDEFTHNRFDAAILEFEAANSCAPADPQISLLLGEAYLTRVVPLENSKSNLALDQQAVDAFSKTLRLLPNDGFAIEGLVEAYALTEQADKERKSLLLFLRVSPPSAALEYALGEVDWRIANLFAIHKLTRLGMFPDDYSKMGLRTCHQIAVTDGPILTEGIEHMERATRMDSTFSFAFSYLQELYKLRAELSCGDNNVRNDDLAKAHSAALRGAQLTGQSETIEPPQVRSTLTPLPSISALWTIVMRPPPPPPIST